MNKITISAMLALLFFSVQAQRTDIMIDGVAEEWNNTETEIYNDDEGDGNGIDLISLSVSNDEEFLYVSFALAENMLLNNNNNLKLYLDTDNDASTGSSINGIGADFQWNFAERRGYSETNPNDPVYHNEIGFTALPTVTSDTFEIRIERYATLNGEPLFPSESIGLVLKDGSSGDMAPNMNDSLSYSFLNIENTFQPSNLYRSDAVDLRLMSFNVLHDGIIKPERRPYFRRIIRAASPDVAVLNECWDATTSEVIEIFNDFIPLPGGESWNAVKKDGGNILVSRYPFIDSYRIHHDMRITAGLIDLPDNKFSGDFVVVGAHFRCCDANEARQREADAFAAFIRDMKEPGGDFSVPENTPFFLAGDLNLVGYTQQLETILTGEIVNSGFGESEMPDWDNTPLLDVISSQTDDPVATTWISNTSSYWPGRLDFTIVSNSVAKVLSSWILDTEDMPQERLTKFNLENNDTKEASDHLPKVTDLKFKEPLSADVSGVKLLNIYPNPAKAELILENVKMKWDTARFVAIETGKEMKVSKLDEMQNNVYRLNTNDLPAGIYILELKGEKNRHYEKVVIKE